MQVFRPTASATLALGTTTANVALPGIFQGPQRRTVRLFNDSPVKAFVEFGDGGSVVATAGATLVLAPGAVELFYPLEGRTHIAALLASGTGTLHITTGEGM